MLQLFVFLLQFVEKWQICLNCVPQEIQVCFELKNFARLRSNLFSQTLILDRDIRKEPLSDLVVETVRQCIWSQTHGLTQICQRFSWSGMGWVKVILLLILLERMCRIAFVSHCHFTLLRVDKAGNWSKIVGKILIIVMWAQILRQLSMLVWKAACHDRFSLYARDIVKSLNSIGLFLVTLTLVHLIGRMSERSWLLSWKRIEVVIEACLLVQVLLFNVHKLLFLFRNHIY